jgi:AcrR family transcriptional regulator
MADETYVEKRRHAIDAIRREQIIEGFAAAVERRGYATTTIADIARAARVSKTTIYEHFEDKDAIYLALHETVAHQVVAQLGALDDTDATRPWRESLRLAIARYLDAMASTPGFLTQIRVEASNATPAMAEARFRAGDRIAEILIAHSKRLAAESDEVTPLSKPLAYACLGGFLGLMQRAAPNGPDAVRALEAPVTELLIRLLLTLPVDQPRAT